MAGAFASSIITSGASAQDECATAPTLVTGVGQAFDTATATVTALPAVTDALCTTTDLNWIATQKDVWYTWTATGDGTAIFSTCFLGSYDTSLVLYTGSCASLVAVACNGDGTGGTGCQTYYSLITYAVTSGTTYYARIGGWGGKTGAGQIKVDFTPATVGCGGATGACDVVHATVGCDNSACCSAICTSNPPCCEIAWDQSCVDLAFDPTITQCGYFNYVCTPGTPANNCATSPTLVTADGSKPFSNVGATQDGPDYGDTCSSGNNECNNDVWYKFTAVANGEATASNCGTVTVDTKMAIYDMGTSPATFNYNTLPDVLVGCNDDGAGGTCYLTGSTTPFASSLTVSVTVGHTYLLCVSSYDDGVTGTGSVLFNLPEPCALPSSTTSEDEACGAATDNGCVSTVAQYQSINVAVGTPTTIGGTFFASADTRDVDAYVFTIPTGMTVTAETFSASNVAMTIYNGLPCATQFIASGAGSCPRTVSSCLPAGTYSIYVAPAFGVNPCGNGVFNNYVLKLTAVASVCPSFGDTCGYTVASEVTQNTSQTIEAYSRGCLLFCGTDESTFSTEVKIARSFPGLTSGALGCVTLGVSNVDYAADGIAYAGAPFTATIGLYRDTDGGDPVGADLVLISQKSFSVLGGNRLLTWNLDSPLSLTGNTNPIVVVLSGLIGGGCDPLTNNVFGGVGGAGSTAPWYVQSITPTTGLCPDGTEFVAKVDQTNQWIVNLGMVSTTPPCPGDFNGDGFRNGGDLATLLSAWGTPAADITGDGTTNGADLAVLLSGWGACPI